MGYFCIRLAVQQQGESGKGYFTPYTATLPESTAKNPGSLSHLSFRVAHKKRLSYTWTSQEMLL
jgi:hypothetical protein